MTVSPTLDERFRAAAAADGLLDVAYDLTDSPIGPLLVAVSERGLCRISFDPEPEREVESLGRAFGTRVLRSPRPLDEVRRELDEYFAGERRSFDLPRRHRAADPVQPRPSSRSSPASRTARSRRTGRSRDRRGGRARRARSEW